MSIKLKSHPSHKNGEKAPIYVLKKVTLTLTVTVQQNPTRGCEENALSLITS